MTEKISGQIERITYTNEADGFTIAKVKIQGHWDLVTVVGNLIAPMPGEILNMTGEWQQHPKYGEQFKVSKYETVVPATVNGIRKYLGSGLIKGIGPVMADRIVKHFGRETLDVIEKDINRLTEVDGIGEQRVQMIRAAWNEQKEIRDVMIFLQSHGVSSGYAAKVFKAYGDRSIAVVKQNPYRLATDIFGIGFITADSIAEKLGFSKDARIRIEAGLLYVLQQLADEGHIYYPYEALVEKAREVLQVNRDAAVQVLKALADDGKVVIEDLNGSTEFSGGNDKGVFLEQFYICETRIADHLHRLIHFPVSPRVSEPDKALAWVQRQLPIDLAHKQIEAIRCAIREKVMVITGGPGTGKTTIINGVLKIYNRLKARVMLAAPTGRAAKRMGESTGHEAMTIHRLLEYSFAKGGFQKNDANPLDCDLLVVDEASMMDTVLMYHLIRAIPLSATFVLVGDVNQLPSVGAGNVLNDIITSGIVPVVALNEIFRQAKSSQIIVNAHRINKGELPFLDSPNTSNAHTDFYFIEQEDPEKVLDIIIELAERRIPRRFGFHPVDDIQILSPMHRGVVGAENLNNTLQEKLNPGKEGIIRGSRTFRVNDKVMQTRNNYEKDVYNGDIGHVARINMMNQELIVIYDGREVSYDYPDLDEIVLAYAVSVHKSQGSEFPVVIVPILTQHYILLQRNLIYTAITRGRHLVVIVGTRKALAIGVNNNKTEKRFTRLEQRLK